MPSGSAGETSGETPGRRTEAERQAIVAEAFEDGNSVSEVAGRHGASTASIYLWRRQVRDATIGATRKTQGRSHPPSPVRLVPVQIATDPEAPTSSQPAPVDRIEIALANGRILRVCDGIDPLTPVRLVAALERTASCSRSRPACASILRSARTTLGISPAWPSQCQPSLPIAGDQPTTLRRSRSP